MIRKPKLSGLAALFLVSLATVGFEIALTRYFAVAKWSEYGYWVISIVLAGFALSGVVLALGRERIAPHGKFLLDWLPALLVATAAIGFHFVTTNPFNPLQLQNQATFWPQVPPGAGPPAEFFHSSIHAVLKPNWAARIAAM